MQTDQKTRKAKRFDCDQPNSLKRPLKMTALSPKAIASPHYFSKQFMINYRKLGEFKQV